MILVDAHVHIYKCFDLEIFLNSALANFMAEAARQGNEHDFTGILLLAETSKDHWFQILSDYSDKEMHVGRWTFHRTQEDCSLWAKADEKEALCILAGRQIVTMERLEVLALITASEFQEGHEILCTIEQIRGQGGIPVIPWGFGKWTGKRGRILDKVIRNSALACLLGDNGGRPAFLPEPSYFQEVTAKGGRVFSGSDPLPFSSESWRAGSFGFSLDGLLNRNKPGAELKRILLSANCRPRHYGKLERPIRFLRNQLAMQCLKMRKNRHGKCSGSEPQHRPSIA